MRSSTGKASAGHDEGEGQAGRVREEVRGQKALVKSKLQSSKM